MAFAYLGFKLVEIGKNHPDHTRYVRERLGPLVADEDLTRYLL